MMIRFYKRLGFLLSYRFFSVAFMAKFFCISLLFLNINFIFSGINFSSKDSKVSVNSSADFGIRNSIVGWNGTLNKKTGAGIFGSTVTFDDGIFSEEGVGSRLSATYSPNETIKLFLNGDKTFKATSGTSLNKINVFGSGNRIEGQPIFSNTDSIRLEHQNTNLTIALQSNLNSDIELRGGTVNLDNDLKFTEDRIFTGSGTVDLQGYGLYFGGKRDLNLTHTINWQNSTDINLTGKTDLSGLWSFDGPSIVNGHGNVLDMSTGGEFYLGHQASLELTNIIMRGIGTDKGNVRFQDNTSTLSTSNVHFDFDDSFSMTVGKLYVDGPTTISGFFSSHRAIDLQNDLFLSGNVTLSCGQGISGNGNTINLQGNLNIQENTPLHFISNTLVEGNGNTIVLGDNAQLFLDTDVSVTLRNVNIKNSKNYLAASPIKLAATTSKLALDNARLSFIDDFYFDRGQIYFYNDVEFTGTNAFIYRSTVPSYVKSGADLKFNPNTIFDFRPSTTGEPGLLAKDLLMMEDESARITFDGCSLKSTFTGFNLTKGSLFLNNKVTFTSAAQLKLTGTESLITQSYGTRVWSTDWSADGRYLAVGGNGPTSGNETQIYSFDGSAFSLITSGNYGTNTLSVNWSPDGKYLAVGGHGADTGFETKVYGFGGTSLSLICSADNEFVYSVEWSPDGKYLVVGGKATNNELVVYNFSGTELIFVNNVDINYDVKSVSWSCDGKYLAIGTEGASAGDEIRVYSFNGSSLSFVTSQKYYQAMSRTVYSVAWSPDGRNLAIGGRGLPDEDEIRVYSFNGSSLSLLASQNYGSNDIWAVGWSADGRYLSAGGMDGIRIYNFKDDSLNLIFKNDYGVLLENVSFSPDGKYLAIGGWLPSGVHDELEVYNLTYGPETGSQAVSNSIVFGNSELGSDYDINLKLLSGAYVEIDGMFNYDNMLGLTPFSNDNAKFVLKDSNSSIRLNPVNVFGWKDRSLLKNITGAGIGDYNLLNYDTSANDIVSYAEAPADFIYYNSNAIVTFQDNYSELIKGNSDAIITLEPLVENNSNAIITLEPLVENNSNAIMWQDVQIKDNSNAIINLEPQVENNSNAILNLEEQVKENSNAIKNLEIQIKDNSNAVDNLAPFVRWNSNAIVSEAEIENFVRWNSNAILNLEPQVENNSNAIIENDDQIRWNSNAIISIDASFDPSLIKHNSNAIVSAIKIYDTTQIYNSDATVENLVLYKNGFTVNTGKTLILNTPLSVRGQITISGTLKIENDLYLDSDVTIPSGGVINGNGNTIFLGADLEIPDDVDLRFTNSTIIDGQGNNLILGHRAQLLIDTLITLTLKNLTLKNNLNNVARPAVKCLDMYGKLALDNATLALGDDFYFNRGQLFVHNDVVVSGSSGLIYRSTQPSFITSGASLTFDIGTTFSYDTATTSSYLINMVDDSSSLYLNGCSLKCTTTGLNLTKGRLFLDNKVLFKNNEIEDLSSLSITTSVHYGLRAYVVQWSPDNKYLAVGGQNNPKDFTVYGWNGSTLEYLTHVNTGAYLNSVDWTADGKYIVVGGSGLEDVYVYSWDGTSLDEKQSLDHGIVYDAKWSPDNKFLAIGCDEDYNELLIYSWTGEALTLTTSQYFGTSVNSVAWHPSRNYVAVGGNYSDTDVVLYGFDGSSLSFMQAESHSGGAKSLEWSSDGNYLAVLGSNASEGLIIYKFSNNSLENIAHALGSGGQSVKWSTNNKYLAVGGGFGDPDIYIYEFTGNSLNLETSLDYGTAASSVDWDADSRYLAVAGENGDNDVTIYLVNYEHVATSPAVDNSIIFGRNESGSGYDLNTRLLSGAFVEVDGMLNIDNTLTTSIFDNDVSKFVLKDSNSKIKFAASSVNGFIDRSIMKQTEGRGFGDYNLLNYDTGADDIVSYSEAPADLLISNSNAIVNLEPQIKDNSNAIKSIEFGDTVTDIRTNSNSAVSLEAGRIGKFLSVNDGILSAIGSINGDTIISGRGILSSPINLNGGILTNGGDILFSSGTTIESSGNLNPIGSTYILGGDITLPENVDLKFTTSGIIDGQGHSWNFGHNSKIKFDEYVTVTLRNIKLNNVRTHSDGNASISILNPWRSKLVLQNSEVNMSDNFSFTSGELFLHGDVRICGTTQFNYTSTSFARIANASQLYFDQGVTFSYGPLSENRDLIDLVDATSVIYINGCTLKSTTTGLILKTGKLVIDGKIIVYNQDDKNGAATSLSQAISFGDGVDDLNVEIMPAANIELMSGILDVN